MAVRRGTPLFCGNRKMPLESGVFYFFSPSTTKSQNRIRDIMSEQAITTPNADEQAQPTATTPEKTGARVFTEAEVENIIKERLSRETSKREKAIQEAAAKAEQDAAARNGEWEKLAKARETKLAELENQLKTRELNEMKRTVAERIGLPVALASRLMGDSEADIERDGKALLETLPKTPKPQPGVVPNPGAGATQVNSDAEMLKRIRSNSPDIFALSAAQQMGGGYISSE